MNHATFEIIDKMESNTAFLSCAVEALSVLHETLEHDVYSREATYGGMGYYLSLCSAMVPVIRELRRINEDLDAIVTAAYEQKKGENGEI